MMNKRIIFYIILVVAFSIFAYYRISTSFKEADELSEKLCREYPNPQKSDSIDFIVYDIFDDYGKNWREDPYGLLVSTKDNLKFRIHSDNCISDPNTKIRSVVTIGSRLLKNRESDTLLVINKDREYRFIILIN